MNQNCCHRAPSLVKLGLDNRSYCIPIRVCLKLLHVGHQQHHFKQLVYTLSGMGGNLHANCIPAPFFQHQALVRQFLLYTSGVGSGFVYLVNSHHQRHTCRPGMVNSLYGLRHDSVIRRHHQYGYIGHLCAPGSHGGESFMAGGVQEYYFPVPYLYLVGSNMLGNAPRLLFGDLCFPYPVKQRCFSMVDMTHYRNNRGAGYHFRLVFLLRQVIHSRFFLFYHQLKAIFPANGGGNLAVNVLVNSRHNPHRDELFYNMSCGNSQNIGQVFYGYFFCYFCCPLNLIVFFLFPGLGVLFIILFLWLFLTLL